MLKFEYQIKLNDQQRPYVHIHEDYQDNAEDKFMAIELTRYLLLSVVSRRSDSMPEGEVKTLNLTLDTLEKISDEIAILLKKEMEVRGENVLNTVRNYHVTVDTIGERDILNYNGILYHDKIFKREIGFKVLVLNEMKIYELQNGIDNNHWVEI
jgi:hypothetical protein